MSDLVEQLRDKQVIVTEVCTPHGTNLALLLARHGISVTGVSSIGKDWTGLRCGLEAQGLSNLFHSEFHHIPSITTKTLEGSRLYKECQPYAVFVIDPLKGSQHALKNLEYWSNVFGPAVAQQQGVITSCAYSQPREIKLWHNFLKRTAIQRRMTLRPRHNVICLGKNPSKASYCKVLNPQTYEDQLAALFGNTSEGTTVHFMKTKN